MGIVKVLNASCNKKTKCVVVEIKKDFNLGIN
jgi:hypothetical protein